MPESRCEFCGSPAGQTPPGSWFCVRCLERYRESSCVECHVRIVRRVDGPADAAEAAPSCRFCRMKTRLGQLDEADREAIRSAASLGSLQGMKEARNRLGWSIPDARVALQVLLTKADP